MPALKVTKPATMMLLPPRSDVCQICATDHEPHLPHNAQSLYYQMAFKIEHGREATWKDALAHCSDEMKDLWIEALAEKGIVVERDK